MEKKTNYLDFFLVNANAPHTAERHGFDTKTHDALVSSHFNLLERAHLAHWNPPPVATTGKHVLIEPNQLQQAHVAAKSQELSPLMTTMMMMQMPKDNKTTTKSGGGEFKKRRAPDEKKVSQVESEGGHQVHSGKSWLQILFALIVCFSLKRNLSVIGKHIKRDEQKQHQADIKLIHGLRTFTMIWIIFGHTIGLVNPEMMSKLLFI